MTDKALMEARKYIERSIEQQQRLGYKKPSAPVVRTAVKDAAKAVDSLLNLRSKSAV